MITAKRLIMTGAIILFQQGSVMQFTIGLLTTYFAGCLQVRSPLFEFFAPSLGNAYVSVL